MVVWWKDGRWLGEEGVNSHHFQKTELKPTLRMRCKGVIILPGWQTMRGGSKSDP